ncbi:mCG1040568, partial [Mus musculus]
MEKDTGLSHPTPNAQWTMWHRVRLLHTTQSHTHGSMKKRIHACRSCFRW